MSERATFHHELSRTVPGVVGQVRTALLRALSDDGFTVDVERTTLVEAGRGSTVSGAMSADRLPVRLAVRLTTVDDGTRVDVSLWDRWPSAATQVRGLDAMYADLFGRLTTLVDRALGTSGAVVVRTGPDGQPGAGVPVAGGAGAPALVDRFGGSAAARARSALSSADRKLSGVRDDWPQRWARVVGLEVRLPGADPERFGRDDIDGVLDVATLLGAQPGDLPPPLVAHVERIAAAVEGALDSGLPLPVLTLGESDAPALLFLRQQAALRETLPERRLLVCRDCRLEKLVNDEYRQITEKQRRLTEIVNRVSVVAPAGMLRQAFRLNRMQPDFVCPRCQGLRADAFVVTFCPACGTQHRDGALKSCRCGLDFRAEAVRLLAARPPAVIVVPPEPPPLVGGAGAGTAASAGWPAAAPMAPTAAMAPMTPMAQPGGATSAASWPSAPQFGAPAAGAPVASPAPQHAAHPPHAAPAPAAPHYIAPQPAPAAPQYAAPQPAPAAPAAPQYAAPQPAPAAPQYAAPQPAPAAPQHAAPQPAPTAPAAAPGFVAPQQSLAPPAQVAPPAQTTPQHSPAGQQLQHTATPAGWYPDPWRAAPLRWWDGRTWTGWTHPPATR